MRPAERGCLRFAGATVAVLALLAPTAQAKSGKSSGKPKVPSTAAAKAEPRSSGPMETYQDLILKAQNLSLQQDRLQAGQVLIRGIERESKGSVASRELTRALDELTSIFYTEKAQNAFANAEALFDAKPREAVEPMQEALKLEDRNVTILKALARTHLRLDECDRAAARVKLAEEINPFSVEIKLLRVQVLACQNKLEEMAGKILSEDFGAVKPYLYGLQIKETAALKDFKKARTLLAEWTAKAPDYPETQFWRWELSRLTGAPDRMAAAKYAQLCLNMTARKRKQHAVDVNLCKARDSVEEFLKQHDAKTGSAITEESH